jgi:hypothetical protein
MKRIESSAFSDTAIRSIELPPRITFIAADAFPLIGRIPPATLANSGAFICWTISRQHGSNHPFEKFNLLHHHPHLLAIADDTDSPHSKHFPG